MMRHDIEQRVLRFLWAMQESASYSDREVVGKALGINPFLVHEVCADLQWRGYLRRHGPRCSGIVLSTRGIAAARTAA